MRRDEKLIKTLLFADRIARQLYLTGIISLELENNFTKAGEKESQGGGGMGHEKETVRNRSGKGMRERDKERERKDEREKK